MGTETGTTSHKEGKNDDSEVAKATASLGRAAQPPPSEKSSTLDAKDSKVRITQYFCVRDPINYLCWCDHTADISGI